MASGNEFASYCAELFGSVGPVRIRRMFGGHGIYLDDLFVAIVSDESLYLKADLQCAPAFEKAGGTRFAYDPPAVNWQSAGANLVARIYFHS